MKIMMADAELARRRLDSSRSLLAALSYIPHALRCVVHSSGLPTPTNLGVNYMKKTILAIASALCLGLVSTAGIAASHMGAPMKGASAPKAAASSSMSTTAPMA
ncbi:MAG: hypothetical protein V4787_05655, partial [Pseudomonadota bacterium]